MIQYFIYIGSFTQNDVLYRWNGKEFCGSLHRSVIGMEYVILPQFNVTRCSIYTSSYERILGLPDSCRCNFTVGLRLEQDRDKSCERKVKGDRFNQISYKKVPRVENNCHKLI